MCGRVTLDIDIELLRKIVNEAYGVSPKQMHIDNYEKRYNITPGQPLLNIINAGEQLRAGYMKWGFIPYYAKSSRDGSRLINVRSETANTKPTFSASFQSKRCVILTTGFYEWNSLGGEKVPHRIQLTHSNVMPMAGLWSRYVDVSGEVHFTCSILTTKPNDMIKHLHHRMPVILNPQNAQYWLSPPSDASTEDLKEILVPYPSDEMSMYPVSDLVNNIKHDSIECIQPRVL